MKQKQLLIAFTALVLTACGGSIDLGPKTPAPPIPEPEEPVGRELVPYEILLTTDRDWFTKGNYQDEDDVPPDVVFIEDGIEIYATSPNQQLVTRVDGPLDMREGTMVFTASVDEDYLTNASGVQPFQQVFTIDDSDPDEDIEEGGNWGCWTGIGDWEPDEKNEITCNVPAGDMYDLAEDQYALIGIQSQGENAEGFLRLHHIDFHYWIGEPEEDDSEGSGFFRELDMTDGWYVGDDLAGDDEPDASAVIYTAEGAGFNPTFAGQWGPKLYYLLDGPVDLTGESFTVEFTVEQTFLDAGGSLSAHAQQHYTGYSEHKCAVDNDDLTAGERFIITCEDMSENMVADEDQALRIGLSLAQADIDVGTITIHRAYIGNPSSGYELLPSAGNIGSWDNDNHGGLDGAPDLSFDSDDGVLVIKPNWDATDSNERTVMYIFEEDVLQNLEGATVSADLYLSDYYVSTHPGMEVQLFIQQNSDGWSGKFGDINPIEEAEDLGGDWYRFKETFTDVPTDPAALRVGLKLQRAGLDTGGDAGEDILLRSINIQYAE